MTNLLESRASAKENSARAQEKTETRPEKENFTLQERMKAFFKEGETLRGQFTEKHSFSFAFLGENAQNISQKEIASLRETLKASGETERGAFLKFKEIMLSCMLGYAVLMHDYASFSKLFPESGKAYAAEKVKKEKSKKPYEEIPYLAPEMMRKMALEEKTEEIFFCFPEAKSCIRPSQMRSTASGMVAKDFSLDVVKEITEKNGSHSYEFIHTHPVEATGTLSGILQTKEKLEPFSYSEESVKRMREKTAIPLPPSMTDFAALFLQQEKTGLDPKGVVYESTGIWRYSLEKNSEGHAILKRLSEISDQTGKIDLDTLAENPEFKKFLMLEESISNLQLFILFSFRQDAKPEEIYSLIEEYRKECKKLGFEVTYHPFSGSDYGEATEELQRRHMPARSPYPPSE